ASRLRPGGIPGPRKVFAIRSRIAVLFAGHLTLGGDMNKNLATLAVPLLFSIGMTAGPAFADGQSNRLFIDRDVDTFAVLPDGVRFPEGITANPANEIGRASCRERV